MTAVDIGLGELADLPGPWSLEVITYAFAPDESVVATSSLAFELDGEIGEGAGLAGIQVVDSLSLEPGDYVLRTLVRERESGELARRQPGSLMPVPPPPPRHLTSSE